MTRPLSEHDLRQHLQKKEQEPSTSLLIGLFRYILSSWVFNGFHKIFKDIEQIGKPFKHPGKAWQAFFKPLTGVKNLLWGALCLLGAPVLAVVAILLTPIVSIYGSIWLMHKFTVDEGFARGVGAALGLVIATPLIPIVPLAIVSLVGIYGLGQTLLGVGRIATAPINLLFVLPVRACVTVYYGGPKIETGKKIQRHVAQAEERFEKKDKVLLKCSFNKIHEQFEKRAELGQSSDIGRELEAKHYTEAKQNPLDKGKAYIKLYRNIETMQPKAIPENTQPVNAA